VVIDWAYVGLGPLGADAGNMAVDAGFDFWLDVVDQRAEPAEKLLTAYLDGLRAGGWRADQALVRRGFFATIAVKYPWTLAALLAANARVEDHSSSTLNDKPFHLVAPGWASSVRQVAEAARVALGELT
jgi:hypothetical protein